jgi:hypothetical protein
VQYRIARGVTDRPEKETKQLSCMLRALHWPEHEWAEVD